MTNVNVAVIGCGHWGKNLVRNFRKLGALQMVCDTAEAGRRRASEIAPRVEIVTHVNAVLNAPVDGVVIATPSDTHYDLVRRALAAGKDVFCEKPLALSYERGEKLVQLANRQRQILMLGHILEYHPGVVQLLSLVRNGELGQLRYILARRFGFGPIRAEGNVLWDFSWHDVTVVLRMIDDMPTRVSAYGSSHLRPGITDTATMNLQYDSGAQAFILASWLYPFKEQRMVAVGSDKMVCFDDVEKQLTLYNHHVELHGAESTLTRGQEETIPFPDDEPLLLECKAFSSAMQTRQSPLADGASGLRALQVLHAAQTSLETNGTPVNISS